MKYKLYLGFISAFIVLNACKQNETISAQFVLKAEKEIFTPKDILNTDRNCVKYYEWDGFPPLLAAYSDISNQIFLFDYNKATVYSTIDIDPLGIDEIRDFQFAKPNELVVVEQMTTNYFVIDSNSHIINQFNLNEHDPKLEYDKFASINGGSFGSPIKIFDNKIITSVSPFGPSVNVLAYYKDIIINDYKTKNEIHHVYNFFDKTYLNEWKFFKNTYYDVKGESVILSRYNDSDLFELKTSGFDKIQLKKSEYLIETDKFDTSQTYNSNFVVEYVLKSSSYVSIHYDKYRKLFYRIVELPIKPYDYESIFFNWSDKKEFSIMIFDEEFNLLGEQKFPAEKYNYHSIIPTSEGLLISTNNSFNPNSFSYKLQYELFDIKLDTIN